MLIEVSMNNSRDHSENPLEVWIGIKQTIHECGLLLVKNQDCKNLALLHQACLELFQKSLYQWKYLSKCIPFFIPRTWRWPFDRLGNIFRVLAQTCYDNLHFKKDNSSTEQLQLQLAKANRLIQQINAEIIFPWYIIEYPSKTSGRGDRIRFKGHHSRPIFDSKYGQFFYKPNIPQHIQKFPTTDTSNEKLSSPKSYDQNDYIDLNTKKNPISPPDNSHSSSNSASSLSPSNENSTSINSSKNIDPTVKTLDTAVKRELKKIQMKLVKYGKATENRALVIEANPGLIMKMKLRINSLLTVVKRLLKDSDWSQQDLYRLNRVSNHLFLSLQLLERQNGERGIRPKIHEKLVGSLKFIDAILQAD